MKPTRPLGAGILRGMMANFVKAANLADLTPGTRVEVEVEGKTLALCNIGGTVYALDNTCLHAGGPIGQGELKSDTVVCPWHGWEYNVKTGECLTRSDVKIATYPVQIENGAIKVEV